MDATALVPVLMGLVYGTVGAYLLCFRPITRSLGVLGAALVANAFAHLIPNSTSAFALLAAGSVAGTLTIAGFTAFFAMYPRPVRWRSLSGALVGVCVIWTLGSAATLILGQLPLAPNTLALALFGTGLGGNLVLVALMAARLPELREASGASADAARWFYLAPLGFVFITSGVNWAKTVAAILGADAYPTFLYTSAHPAETLLRLLMLAVLAPAVSLYGIVRWRWWTPTALLAIGTLSYVALLLPRADDTAALRTLGAAGELFTPAFVLYAQARYAPFQGEPASARPGLLVTGVSALLAYLSVFALTLIFAPGPSLAAVLGPILGLVGAVGMVALVLPRTRRLALQRIFTTAPGAAPDPLAAGSSILGRYHIVRLLAEGGQGRVYEATDARGGGSGRVVLKAVTNEHALREARILRGLGHPNVVRFVDVVEIPGLTLLVLDYAEGGDLRGLLTRRGGRLATADALALAHGILAGLAAAHARGVTHRDIKPENVLLDAQGRPKLTDFGAARDASPGATIRVGGLGTLAYLAPEQVRGEPGDARSDVYAAAVLIHELLTGERPISTAAGDDFLVRHAILHEPARIALPPEAAHLAHVLERALAKGPDARFPDAGEMLAAMAPAPGAAVG